MMITMDQVYRPLMDERLKQAGEWQYMRYPHPWHNPAFKSAPAAAQRLLEAYPHFKHIVVLRDQCLRPLREMILDQGRVLLVPDQAGKALIRVPRSALYVNGVRSSALRLTSLPKDAEPYTGPVDAIVVGCLGFSPERRCTYDLELGRSTRTVGHIQLTHAPVSANGRHENIPVIALAADCQQVDWPEGMKSYIKIDAVITKTRILKMEVSNGTHIE